VRHRAKVTNDRLYRKSVVYEKSIGTKMNDLDLCLEVISIEYLSETVRERLGSKGPPIGGNGIWAVEGSCD